MTKFNKMRILVLTVLLIMALLVGCSGSTETLLSTDEDFAFGYGIAADGFWKGIKAAKLVDLCEYNGITIPKDVHEVSEETVMTEIANMMTGFEEDVVVTDRPIENLDTVNIDYVGSIDGVEFAGGNTQEQGADVTIGVTQYIDDFLEQLIGHSPGEKFDIEVTFPDDYHSEDLAGKDAVFAITVNHIIDKKVPELTDEFVAENMKDTYGWTTVEQMKEYVRESKQTSAIEYFLQDYVVNNTTVNELPQVIVEYQEYSMIRYYQDYANYYQMTFEDFIAAATQTTTTEELLESTLSQNEGTAKLYLILQAIAETEKIKISEEEAVNFFASISQSGSHEEYENMYGMNHMKMIALQRKVLDAIKESMVLE